MSLEDAALELVLNEPKKRRGPNTLSQRGGLIVTHRGVSVRSCSRENEVGPRGAKTLGFRRRRAQSGNIESEMEDEFDGAR